MKNDGVYIYSIVRDDNDPIASNYSFELLFSCTGDKFEWLSLDKNLRFCIPIKKENGILLSLGYDERYSIRTITSSYAERGSVCK